QQPRELGGRALPSRTVTNSRVTQCRNQRAVLICVPNHLVKPDLSPGWQLAQGFRANLMSDAVGKGVQEVTDEDPIAFGYPPGEIERAHSQQLDTPFEPVLDQKGADIPESLRQLRQDDPHSGIRERERYRQRAAAASDVH